MTPTLNNPDRIPYPNPNINPKPHRPYTTTSSCCDCLAAAEGFGKLLDAHTVEVTLSAGGTERITAKHILLAVGGRAVKAPIEGSVSRAGWSAHPGASLEYCRIRPDQAS